MLMFNRFPIILHLIKLNCCVQILSSVENEAVYRFVWKCFIELNSLRVSSLFGVKSFITWSTLSGEWMGISQTHQI